jgi:hypothetical protein
MWYSCIYFVTKFYKEITVPRGGQPLDCASAAFGYTKKQKQFITK